MKYCMDASVLITAWNTHYKAGVFPSLWRKLGEHSKSFVFIQPIYDEIDPSELRERSREPQKYPLKNWMDQQGIVATSIDSAIEEQSMTMAAKYKIDLKHSKGGVNANDIKLIVFAKSKRYPVVTYERRQPALPSQKYKYKIPLICAEEGVRCIKLISMMEELKLKI